MLFFPVHTSPSGTRGLMLWRLSRQFPRNFPSKTHYHIYSIVMKPLVITQQSLFRMRIVIWGQIEFKGQHLWRECTVIQKVLRILRTTPEYTQFGCTCRHVSSVLDCCCWCSENQPVLRDHCRAGIKLHVSTCKVYFAAISVFPQSILLEMCGLEWPELEDHTSITVNH